MFQEGSQQHEQTESPELDGITSFEELYDFIRRQGIIQGSRRDYDADELIKIIERVRHGYEPTGYVTRTMEIRKAVERLLLHDRVYLKYTVGSRSKKK